MTEELEPEAKKDSRRFYEKKRVRIPTLLIVGIVAVVLGIVGVLLSRMVIRGQTRDFSAEEWRAIWADDVKMLRVWNGQLEEAVEYLETIAAETPDDSATVLSPDDANRVRELWGRTYDLCESITRRADFHRDFVLFLKDNRRDDHARGFLLCDAADLVVQDAGLRLADAMGGESRWEVILNEQNDAYGIPDRAFDTMKEDIVSIERTSRQLAARQYWKVLRKTWAVTELSTDDLAYELECTVDELHPRVSSRLRQQGTELLKKQTEDMTKDKAFEAWFPLQKKVANTMGNIRVKRQGVYLISQEQIAQLRTKLEPGDIFISRKHWYASNAGIPGFWPHAMLYVGSPDELAAYFDDPDVIAWCEVQNPGVHSFPELLSHAHLHAWEAYNEGRSLVLHGDGEEEHQGTETEEHFVNRVIESIAEGVSFHPAEQSLSADCLGVLRPRLTKIEKAEALLRAFSHHGKPYDYNFDFTSDAALVCSELVFKAYQPSENFKGLDLKLDSTLGRPMLAPTQIAKQFDLEWNAPNQQLDFVAFLDSRESEGVAVWETMETFRRSWMRPKWSAAQ